MKRWTLLIALSAGCAKPDGSAVVLEGFGFGWRGFNHRLSHLEFAADEDGARAAVVGGTSTTGVAPELPESCDADTCKEFPFFDTPEADLRWAQITGPGLASGRAQAALEAGASGASATVTVPLSGKAEAGAAVIAGLTLDTDHPLSDGAASCYNPAYGWHPRRIAVVLSAPRFAADGMSATVDVEAFFEAGNSLEPERVCIDEVRAKAVAAVTVDVQVISAELGSQAVAHGMAYAWNGDRFEPDPQPEPDPAARQISQTLSGGAYGWGSVDWRFHVDDPDDRGAYLRTLSAVADGESASGHATNYSPGTQLSGFDYEFAGDLRAFDGEIVRGGVQQDVPITLDAGGHAVPVDFSLGL